MYLIYVFNSSSKESKFYFSEENSENIIKQLCLTILKNSLEQLKLFKHIQITDFEFIPYTTSEYGLKINFTQFPTEFYKITIAEEFNECDSLENQFLTHPSDKIREFAKEIVDSKEMRMRWKVHRATAKYFREMAQNED